MVEVVVRVVEKLNGYDAWALFKTCALGECERLRRSSRKTGVWSMRSIGISFHPHGCVHTDIVKLLLERGAVPAQSRY